MLHKIETIGAPPATGPFSQAVVTNGMVFTAGQIHLTPEGKLVEGSSEEKVERIMLNLGAILEAAGSSFSDVVKTTIYVTNMADYASVNEVYSRYVRDPFPARETVCVKELPLGASVEISMVAVVHEV